MNTLKTEYFEQTASDLKKRLNPANDPEGWQYGSAEAYTEADVIELLNEKEETIIAALPEAYRQWIGRCDGEIICAFSSDAQTTAQCTLLPLVEGSCTVCVNYPKDLPWNSDDRLWQQRRSECQYPYTVDYSTGLVTFREPLPVGSWVYATYRHKAQTRCRLLKRLALDLAVVQLARDNHLDLENWEIWRDLETTVYSTLKKMTVRGDGKVSIPLFDSVNAVKPLRNASNTGTWGYGYV